MPEALLLIGPLVIVVAAGLVVAGQARGRAAPVDRKVALAALAASGFAALAVAAVVLIVVLRA